MPKRLEAFIRLNGENHTCIGLVEVILINASEPHGGVIDHGNVTNKPL